MAIAALPLEIQPEYARLLKKALPSVIESEEQNELYLQQLTNLLHREDSLSPAEQEFAKLLTLLIEDFEEKHYSLTKASPLGVIAFLMDQHNLKQKDLTGIFGAPSITSEVLNGKRELNKEQIRRLSERFHVSPEVFF
ncbi:MAG: transcriptional regulator [Acidobacteriota bacterium]